MINSDSEDEDHMPDDCAPPPPSQLPKIDHETSFTKYLPPETSSGDEDKESEAAGGEAKPEVNYVEVVPVGMGGVSTSASEEVKKKPAASVTYAEVKHEEKKTVRSLFRKNKKGKIKCLSQDKEILRYFFLSYVPSLNSLLFFSSQLITVLFFILSGTNSSLPIAQSLPPPPPPPPVVPTRGIIKNRLSSQKVKKLKQARVKWSKQGKV